MATETLLKINDTILDEALLIDSAFFCRNAVDVLTPTITTDMGRTVRLLLAIYSFYREKLLDKTHPVFIFSNNRL